MYCVRFCVHFVSPDCTFNVKRYRIVACSGWDNINSFTISSLYVSFLNEKMFQNTVILYLLEQPIYHLGDQWSWLCRREFLVLYLNEVFDGSPCIGLFIYYYMISIPFIHFVIPPFKTMYILFRWILNSIDYLPPFFRFTRGIFNGSTF